MFVSKGFDALTPFQPLHPKILGAGANGISTLKPYEELKPINKFSAFDCSS
jgi:hypothetical protein